MKLVSIKCPYCSSDLVIDEEKNIAVCEYCGAKLLIDDEIEKKPYDAEESGYNFEKGRQRAIDEYRKSRGFSSESIQDTVDAVEDFLDKNIGAVTVKDENNKSKWWLWILGWVFFFPIPLSILIYRTDKLEKKAKIILIIILWTLVLYIGRN